MVDTRTARRVLAVLSLFLLCIAPGFIAGCGTATHASSVFNAPAPLPADITIPYAVGGSNPPATPGVTGLRARDGAYAWHAATGEPNSQVPPVEVNGVIYIEGGFVPGPQGSVDQTGTVAAVRATDGRILWQVALPTGEGTDNRDFRIATDGIMVLVTDPTAGLYALAATTGAVRWHMDQASTWPLAVRDGVAVVRLSDSQGNRAHVAVYQEDDGKLLWQGEDYSSAGTNDVITIGINHSAVYLTGQTEIIAYAARTGRQLWRQDMGGGIVGVDDHTVTLGLLGGIHSVACLDAATGSVIWSVDGSFGGWSSKMQTPTAVYFTDADGEHLIALSMTNGTQLWQAEFPGYRVDSIAQAQGVVFARLFGPINSFGPNVPERLAALDGSRGTVYWERDQQMYSLVNTPL